MQYGPPLFDNNSNLKAVNLWVPTMSLFKNMQLIFLHHDRIILNQFKKYCRAVMMCDA